MSRSEEANRIDRYVAELTRIFKTASSKHQAHQHSRRLLEDISTDRLFITGILRSYLANPQVLNSRHYPVVGINIELNPDYHLVANGWIPLPNRDADVSTKAIHHHGTLLLSTATIFGPGYEHWLFTQPEELDPEKELYAMGVTERKLHPHHDVAFVGAFEPHLPMYPSGLTITLALWSGRSRTSWKDQLKRVPILKTNEQRLRRWVERIGLEKKLELKRACYFDFTPTEKGFKGMKDRIEFPLGPNEDYLQSLFHILQETGNDGLVPMVERHLEEARVPFVNQSRIQRLLEDLRQGHPVEGRLSDCHLGLSHATFRSQDVLRTVSALEAQKDREAVPPSVG